MRLNFKRLGLLGGKAARARARVLELTSARLDLLTILFTRELKQVTIAQILCVAPSVVSRMLDALEREQWIQRRPHPYDRRAKLVSIAPMGQARLEPYLDAQNHLDPTGQTSAQCEGEARWFYDWRKPLARIGLGLAEFFDKSHDADTLFYRMHWWNRRHTYDSVFNWWNFKLREHPDARD